MTLQELKDNRNEIIDLIHSKGYEAFTKEIMNAMVKMLGYRPFETLSVKQYTLAVIEMNKEEYREKVDGQAIENMYAKASMAQRGSSMR